MIPLSTLLLSFQHQLKTHDVLLVVLLFANFLVPKLYLYLVFPTLIGLHPEFFQDLNSRFGTCLIDPSPFVVFESPSNSYCSITLYFLQLLYIFDLNPYNLYHLHLCLLFPKNLEIKILKIKLKNPNFDIYKKQHFQ